MFDALAPCCAWTGPHMASASIARNLMAHLPGRRANPTGLRHGNCGETANGNARASPSHHGDRMNLRNAIACALAAATASPVLAQQPTRTPGGFGAMDRNQDGY